MRVCKFGLYAIGISNYTSHWAQHMRATRLCCVDRACAIVARVWVVGAGRVCSLGDGTVWAAASLRVACVWAWCALWVGTLIVRGCELMRLYMIARARRGGARGVRGWSSRVVWWARRRRRTRKLGIVIWACWPIALLCRMCGARCDRFRCAARGARVAVFTRCVAQPRQFAHAHTLARAAPRARIPIIG